ncbi:hypothetical protein NQZ79_g8757 [Umbelopsis isabellina]|nr:hypothetical protein NQZ79_g8757 [Umbelopsis isabellina]
MSLSYEAKIFRTTLSESGFIYKCKPVNSKTIPETGFQEGSPQLQPLCQFVDVLVDDKCLTTTSNDERQRFQQFVNSIGHSTIHGPYSLKTDRVTIDPCALSNDFVLDDERRQSLIEELITTEENYVGNMTAFYNLIVSPLRLRAKGKQQILGLYQCNTIFNNIEQILQVNQEFLAELLRWKLTRDSLFGDICAKFMYNMDCYTKFLQGVDAAQEINIQEQKSNHLYRTFLQVAKRNPSLGSQTLYDMLAQPGQRIGRYTMLFKVILKHTSPSEQDHSSLVAALKKAEEIATLADDSPVRLAKIFFNMHRSIQNCPASLISQSRTLVSHLDAVELDSSTLKPLRPITIFLFTDKLMVVRRPAYNLRGLDLCGIQNDSPGFESMLLKKLEKNVMKPDRQLKFKDWINLEDVDLLQGNQDLMTSFRLRARNTSSKLNAQTSGQESSNYFADQPIRLFGVSYSDVQFNTALNDRESLQAKSTFVKLFGRTKARIYQNEVMTTTYHREWNSINLYSNVYSLDQYNLCNHKSDVCVIYVEHISDDDGRSMVEISDQPSVAMMIEPISNECYRLNIRSKSKFKVNGATDSASSLLQYEFADVLCANILYFSMKVNSQTDASVEAQKALRRRNSRGVLVSSTLSTSRLLGGTTYLPLVTTSISTSRPRPKSTASGSDILKNIESRIARRNSYASTLNSKPSRDSNISLHSNNSDVEEPSNQSGLSVASNVSFENEQDLDDGIILSTQKPTASQVIARARRLSLSNQGKAQMSRKSSFRLPPVSVSDGPLFGPMIDGEPVARSASRSSLSSSINSSEPGSVFSTITSRTSTLSTMSNNSKSRKDPVEQNVSQMMRWMQNQQANSNLETRISSLEKIMAVADKLKGDLSARCENLMDTYEQLKLTQEILMRKVKEKDSEIVSIQAMYQDAIDENQILYQTFNDELDQLLKIIARESSSDHRPAHPTPEEQIKRKLKAVLKERNEWQQIASELEKKLYGMTIGQIQNGNPEAATHDT